MIPIERIRVKPVDSKEADPMRVALTLSPILVKGLLSVAGYVVAYAKSMPDKIGGQFGWLRKVGRRVVGRLEEKLLRYVNAE